MCVRETTHDTDGVIKTEITYTYDSENDMPDTIYYKDIELNDSTLGIITFNFFPSDLYFEKRFTIDSETLLDRIYYNLQGQLTYDSGFYEGVDLCYYSHYHYLPDGRLSHISSYNISGANISTADTIYWKYNGNGTIDSINVVYYDFGELFWVDIFFPEYDSIDRIERTSHFYGDPHEPLKSDYSVYYYPDAPITQKYNVKRFNTINFLDGVSNIYCLGDISELGSVFYEIYDCKGKRLYQSKQIDVSSSDNPFIILLSSVGISTNGKYLLKLTNKLKHFIHPFTLLK